MLKGCPELATTNRPYERGMVSAWPGRINEPLMLLAFWIAPTEVP